MRIISSYILIILFIVFSSQAYAESPEFIAQKAFKLQMNESYESMFKLYDEGSLKTVTDQFKNVLITGPFDDSKVVLLQSMFEVSDLKELNSMSPQTFMAKLYTWVFSAQLTEEERSLFRALQFELINVDYPNSSTALVNYNIVISTENGDFRRQKNMSLVFVNGNWAVKVEQALIETLSKVLEG